MRGYSTGRCIWAWRQKDAVAGAVAVAGSGSLVILMAAQAHPHRLHHHHYQYHHPHHQWSVLAMGGNQGSRKTSSMAARREAHAYVSFSL